MSRLFGAVICWPFEAGTRLICRWRGHKRLCARSRCRRPFCRAALPPEGANQ